MVQPGAAAPLLPRRRLPRDAAQIRADRLAGAGRRRLARGAGADDHPQSRRHAENVQRPEGACLRREILPRDLLLPAARRRRLRL